MKTQTPAIILLNGVSQIMIHGAIRGKRTSEWETVLTRHEVLIHADHVSVRVVGSRYTDDQPGGHLVNLKSDKPAVVDFIRQIEAATIEMGQEPNLPKRTNESESINAIR